ncbi:MAG TPA: heme-dependent peroxidase [Bryobacteraceae bacterium]|nr:heme-dependent peroxidase [Bryobacterales bacterium]HRJ19060.1 heme-dependent peroxidase [Bryobacteraceae bacterium]
MTNATPALPMAPLTLDGSSALHQMFRVKWDEWLDTDLQTRDHIAAEAIQWLDSAGQAPAGSQSAAFAMLGHKGDLLLVHFRPDFPGLLAAQREFEGLRFARYLELRHSYVSVVELGLYESTRKLYEELGAQGLAPGTPEWDSAAAAIIDRQRKAMAVRLYPEIPSSRYLCFYPMDKKRGETKNWYSMPFADRQRLMHEHGMIGRKYAGIVKQVISGSIGFDDWEWGVDLFADSPLPFKQLIYEMRFDEASADYGLFGPFFIGLRLPGKALALWLAGDTAAAMAV